MDVSIPMLTKLVSKCGKQYLCLTILQIIKQKLHSCKMVIYTDQTQSHSTVKNYKKRDVK